MTSDATDNTLPEGVPSQIWLNGKFVSIEEYRRLMQLERDLLPHRALGNSNNDVWYDKPAGSLSNEVDGSSSASCVGCPVSGRPEGATSSLVPYKSITYTVPKYPSDIAKEALGKLDPKNPNYQLCFNFVEYLDQCEQKGFMIKGYDTKKGKIVNLPMDYNNRWQPVRRKDLSEKLKRLEYWFELQEDRPVTMITLTSYHDGLSVSSAWHELNKSRVRLLKLIRKYFGDVDYFWVPEPHKSGYVHYHTAIFAEVNNDFRYWTHEYEIDWFRGDIKIEDKFRDLWSRKYKTGNHTYGLDFSQKKDETKIQHLKNYLSKYLAKGFLLDKWTQGMLIFNANLWETGFRMYGASKNIREIMNIEDEKPNQIVWLETKMQYPETTPDGEEIETEKVIYYRQYIPDWIDSDFWLFDGKLAIVDPPAKYIHDWGRKATGRIDPVVHRWVSRGEWTT